MEISGFVWIEFHAIQIAGIINYDTINDLFPAKFAHFNSNAKMATLFD